MIIASPDLMPLPEGQMFYLHDSMFKKDKRGREIPNFSTAEVGRCFFCTSTAWMYMRYRDGRFIGADGVEYVGKRDPKTDHRYFSLADIERMAHAIASNGGIDGRRLRLTVLICKSVAESYGCL